MRIGIDTTILTIDNAGSAVYTRELLASLKAIDKFNTYEYFSYANPKNAFKKGKLQKKFDNIVSDVLWGQFSLPRSASMKGVDVLHCPALKAPLRCKMPLVVTFYDMHILKNPGDYNLWLAMYCKFMLKRIAQSAAKIITISEFSKKDIVETLSIAEEKVAVTYCGANANFRPIDDAQSKESVKNKYGLNKRFILYVGAMQPRKNIPLLLNAYSGLKKSSQFDHDLVFVSSGGWRNKNIYDLISNLNISADIKFLNCLPENDLAVIYNLADFFVYPSFFEGFGMPVLEAMSCGCPVICSSVSSLPEVVGDAGIMINPNDAQELEDAMKNVIRDNILRQSLRDKGLRRAKLFSWENCARDTLKIYKEFS